MEVNGTLINYYFHCQRQCYLHGNRLNLEDESENVKIGKALHEEKYKDDSFFEIQVTPQFSCTDTWFNIATYPNYLAGGDKKKYLINSKKTPKKNTIHSRCSHIHRVNSTWDMCVTILLEMQLLDLRE